MRLFTYEEAHLLIYVVGDGHYITKKYQESNQHWLLDSSLVFTHHFIIYMAQLNTFLYSDYKI